MKHSKKKGHQAELPEQDAMGSADDFAPGGSDSADRRGGEGFDAGATKGAVQDPPAETITSQSATAQDEQSDLAAERDKYLRLAAEYDNYRKRSVRERQDAGARAQADLVRELVEP